MADDPIASDGEWAKVRRQHRSPRFEPIVTVRSSGVLALSADFVRMAEIDKFGFVTFFLSKDGRKLALHLHNVEGDPDAFRITADGGSTSRKPTKNRLIAANSLLKQSKTLQAISRSQSASARRFLPSRIGPDRWAISLMPCFETMLRTGETPPQGTGIYRYSRAGDFTVYIGRGNFRQRFAEPERKQWDFEFVRYSVLNDDALEKQWEAYWLDDHRQRYGQWPEYNRIAAAVSKAG